ncbi:CUB domain-containing protein 2 [Hyposmocoma kahamanoa]|uniref:CUB domain-containing protein 2 n=1 Tax=Hyposmocoma kahamanoa TaxID=1477025 RepID=UPI000E6D808C|nr:CUB domain-containing protein 2 [Hyposmocoma kahamanoa]
MAAAHWLNSLGCLSLSLLCLFATTLQHTSVRAEPTEVASRASLAEPAPTKLPKCDRTFVSRGGGVGNGTFHAPELVNPSNQSRQCLYTFLAAAGQRVLVEFRTFDLRGKPPDGAAVGELPTCFHEYMDIYSEMASLEQSELVNSAFGGRYCGPIPPRRRVSLHRAVALAFFTDNFISKHDAEHIRGSECDQKILSKKESTGYVYHPNYPFPYIQKVVCRYFIYGMQDSQNLERVRLEFQNFSIPKGEKPKPDSNCPDGYLKVYLRGQEATDSYDKHDAELCGEGSPGPPAFPAPLLSDGPRLVMVFSSGENQGRGFKAKYTFETEYRVPGTAAPGGECAFTYRSESKKRGEFNSPRYPSNYPSHTNCTYTLDATPNEQVTVVFDHFKVRADSWNATAGLYGGATCSEDWVEAWWTGREGTRVPLGRWCGLATPGPLQSPRGALGLLIALHTDTDAVASGFKARYVFEPAKSIFGDCGGNMSGVEYGVITSPRWPLPYEPPTRGAASRVCNWFVTARPGKRLLLNFEHFAVEGHLTERGCPAAVLRLWYESPGPPLELCGEKAPSDRWQYLSSSNSIRLSFIIADKSVGAAGWRAVWTEVTVPEGGACPPLGAGAPGDCAGACLPPAAACTGLPHCAHHRPAKYPHCGAGERGGCARVAPALALALALALAAPH